MAKKKGQGVSRRDFMKIAGVGSAAAAGMGTAFLFPERAAAQQKTLKILQWSHFVPAWDEWFNKKYVVEWGQKNNTTVTVDNINLVDLKTRAASEVSAKKGHDLRAGAKKIKDKTGHPCGLGLSQELDTSMAMRALLWSFGGTEQDEHGNVTLNSKNTVEALKFMKALYQESETAEVFTWTPPSNNQAMLAGRVSYVANAISITRQSEREKMPIDAKLGISQALRGPVRRIAAEHVMNCYVVWEFAENKDGAQQFLIDYIDAFHDGFAAGQFYNFPCFPKAVPNLQAEIANDPRSNPPDRYKVLGNVLDWATNVGYPGYASAAIDEAFTTWVLPTMFAKVARGDETPENAAAAAHAEYKRIFDRFK